MCIRRIMSTVLSLCIVVGCSSAPIFADTTDDQLSVTNQSEDDASTDDNAIDINENSESDNETIVVEEDPVVFDEIVDIEADEEIDDNDLIEVEEETLIWEEASFSPDDIEITTTLFPDSAFRAYVSSSSVDLNQDGYLSPSEISPVTSIDVSGLGIYYLDGIEVFSDLQVLDCSSNNLSALDISSNTNLVELYCYANPLQTLDVSTNAMLSSSVDNAAPTSGVISGNAYVSYTYSVGNVDRILVFGTNTSVTSANSITYSITYYGADGSDAIDDYSGFVSSTAVALSTVNKIIIVIPEGHYYISNRVPIYSNTSIFADEDAIIESTCPGLTNITMFYGHIRTMV